MHDVRVPTTIRIPPLDIRRKYDRVNQLRWSRRRSGLKRG